MVSSTDSVVCDSQTTLFSSRTVTFSTAASPSTSCTCVGRFPGGTDDFLVALMTNQQNVVVVTGESPGLVVHLGDQRAGGVDGLQVTFGGRRVHGRRDPVRGEHHDGPFGNLVGLLDEHRTGLDQRVNHVPVVHDLVAHVDRGAVLLQRTLDRFDGPIHTCAVATRLRQEHPFSGWAVGYRSGCAGNPHIDSRRHDVQRTFCRHGPASSRLGLELAAA